MLVAYGLALPVPFVVCVMAVVVLSRPGPPLPLVKGLVVALVFAALVAAGDRDGSAARELRVRRRAADGGRALRVFFGGLGRGNPLTMILVMSFTLIPVAGVAEQALVGTLSVTLAIGVLIGVLVSAVSTRCSRIRRHRPGSRRRGARLSRRRPPGSPFAPR